MQRHVYASRLSTPIYSPPLPYLPPRATMLKPQTVAKWDTETGQRIGNMLALEGLIQCVQMAAEGGDGLEISTGGGGGGGGGSAGGVGRVAYAGSTSKKIYTVDARDPMSVVAEWNCGSFVNSLHVYSDGSKVMGNASIDRHVVLSAKQSSQEKSELLISADQVSPGAILNHRKFNNGRMWG